MSSKTLVLITGANQGLGFYAAQQMAATGKYHVLIGARDIKKAESAIQQLAGDSSLKVDASSLEPLLIDANSDESIDAAAKAVEQKHARLDILMVNAGIAGDQTATSSKSLRQTYREHYETNVFGAVQTVESFLPLLKKSTVAGGKRIAFTSSGLSSLEYALQDGIYSAENYTVYRSTKTALNMIMLGYAKSLEKEGFVVSASDPGYCGTNLNSYAGMKDPRDGAKVLVRAAVESKDKVHAHVIDEEKFEPW
ncbi:hypothetical protein D0869_11375 [Hortaea werneckii]|uniref:NAD(P)-binding protein n=1 Tax=Hortaea werneckii TaxID=91943 RepID=A0A3M6WAX3_HORWE|nr:NAD(P)-binding protein [Hortaea werneckii]KAI7564246.1 NAD(P)-binding protein [Hortaea werneckii]RMX75704.1 hypothetical protein D0869_11375 [Hortaea werneckii]RMX91216.1 hypothetical protein D0868_14118 [Hortaea werneckii]